MDGDVVVDGDVDVVERVFGGEGWGCAFLELAYGCVEDRCRCRCRRHSCCFFRPWEGGCRIFFWALWEWVNNFGVGKVRADG